MTSVRENVQKVDFLVIGSGIAGLTYQALRRTHATHFQRHGDLKDTQAQPEPTGAHTA